MDPNANLREMLELAAAILAAGAEEESTDVDNAFRLAELVGALDGWITGGGFLPARWAQK